jgi:phage terminase large subunit-like protein
VDLAASAGLVLDPWQAFVLDQSLGERADGKWAAFEVGVIVSRQNGKGAILEARELAGLFLFGEQLLLHSAHEFKTASDAFRRIAALVQDNRQFERHVKRIRTANGSEMIELKSGQRLRFVARSAGSGRGFAADVVILDEAYELGDAAMAALLPTLSARPNPQIWYTSTAGNEMSVQLGRIRERGVRGGDESLAFFEWSAGEDDDPGSPDTWAKANPGMGIRISEDYLWREHAALSAPAFATERLGIGHYPVDLLNAWAVIAKEPWSGLVDRGSAARDPVAFGLEVTKVTPHRLMAAIGTAGVRPDGHSHVEVVDHHEGTAWVVPRMLELWQRWRPCAVVVDPTSHAGALIEELEKAGVEVVKPFGPRDAAQAFGQFRNAVAESDLRHLDQEPLNAGLAGALIRTLGDGEAWDRRNAAVDIGPLVSVTLALWGANKFGRPRLAPYDLLRSIG